MCPSRFARHSRTAPATRPALTSRARLRAYRLTGDTAAPAEASAAIQATRDLVVRAGAALRHGEPAGMSLCHGPAGAAEPFLTAAGVLGCEDHPRAAVNVGRLMLGHRDRMGAWPCGVAGVAEVPDLFLGLAGIGLTLLRLHAPNTVMSVSPTGWSRRAGPPVPSPRRPKPFGDPSGSGAVGQPHHDAKAHGRITYPPPAPPTCTRPNQSPSGIPSLFRPFPDLHYG